MSNAFVKPEDLLSSFHREMLSINAQSLFACVWNRLRQRNIDGIWYKDSEICRRARILPQHLLRVQRECVSAGLLHITPGQIQNRYELATFDEPDNAFGVTAD